MLLEERPQLPRPAPEGADVPALEHDLGQARERRVIQDAAEFDLLVVEGGVVARRGRGDGEVGRRRRLDDGLGVGGVADEVEHGRHGFVGPLPGAIIGKAQEILRPEDGHQPGLGQPGLMDEELRPDEERRPALGEVGQEAPPVLRLGSRVGIEAGRPDLGKETAELLLDRLGSRAPADGQLAAAAVAGAAGVDAGIAVMAEQAVLGLVIDEGDIAAGAPGHAAAARTDDLGGVAPPVEEEDGRLSPVQDGPKPALELAGDDRGVAGVVDERHGGPPRFRPQPDEEAAPLRFGEGLDGRPGRTEDGDGPFGPGPEPGAPAGIVGGALGLEVRFLLLVLDGDHAERSRFEKERGPRPGDERRPAAPQNAPGLLPLFRRHPAVEDDGLAAVVRLEGGDQGFRRGDLGVEKKDPAAARHGPPHQGLERRPARAVGAEKIPDPGLPVGDGLLDRRQGPGFAERFGEGQAELDRRVGAGCGSRRRRRGADRPLDGDEPGLLHPGDEARDVAPAERPPEREGAPPLRRAPARAAASSLAFGPSPVWARASRPAGVRTTATLALPASDGGRAVWRISPHDERNSAPSRPVNSRKRSSRKGRSSRTSMSSLSLTPAAGGSDVTATMKPLWRRGPRGAMTRAPGRAAARNASGTA